MSYDPFARAYQPTIPDDQNDPPQFGQPTETTKDAFVLELRHFFQTYYADANLRSEVPTIEKYTSFTDGSDPAATVTSIMRKFPEHGEKLPHVAVMASGGTERRLNIGPPKLLTVQDPAQVTSILPEPYALVAGDTLAIQTTPVGRKNPVVEIVSFGASWFPTGHPISAALAKDVCRVINTQVNHTTAKVTTVNGLNYVTLMAGGHIDQKNGANPTSIQVNYASSANALTALGFGTSGSLTGIAVSSPGVAIVTASGSPNFTGALVGSFIQVFGTAQPYFNDGQFLITAVPSSTTLQVAIPYVLTEPGTTARFFIGAYDNWKNPLRPPKHRYSMSFDLNVEISVLTEDDNTRSELSDLVISFFSFFLEQKYFAFFGRTGFPGQEAITNESYDITIRSPISGFNETEVARPGDGTGKVYISSLVVPVRINQFLDRAALWPGTNIPAIIDKTNVSVNTDLLRGLADEQSGFDVNGWKLVG